jgi:hypothetical protein
MYYAVCEGYIYWEEEGNCALMIYCIIVVGIEEQLD